MKATPVKGPGRLMVGMMCKMIADMPPDDVGEFVDKMIAVMISVRLGEDTPPEVMLRQALQQVEQCFAMISPVLKDLGRATLVEWAQTKSSSNETATILGGFIHSSKFMPKAPALLETPIKVVSREN